MVLQTLDLKAHNDMSTRFVFNDGRRSRLGTQGYDFIDIGNVLTNIAFFERHMMLRKPRFLFCTSVSSGLRINNDAQ